MRFLLATTPASSQRVTYRPFPIVMPGLKATLDASMRNAYRLALIEAERETGLARRIFPSVCPYDYDQATRADFWPE